MLSLALTYTLYIVAVGKMNQITHPFSNSCKLCKYCPCPRDPDARGFHRPDTETGTLGVSSPDSFGQPIGSLHATSESQSAGTETCPKIWFLKGCNQIESLVMKHINPRGWLQLQKDHRSNPQAGSILDTFISERNSSINVRDPWCFRCKAPAKTGSTNCLHKERRGKHKQYSSFPWAKWMA